MNSSYSNPNQNQNQNQTTSKNLQQQIQAPPPRHRSAPFNEPAIAAAPPAPAPAPAPAPSSSSLARTRARRGGRQALLAPGSAAMLSSSTKDRHSKVRTARGLRDRRVRLSAPTAIQFFDVQDRLGYDQPSKAVDWLMSKARSAIDDLARRPFHPPPSPQVAVGLLNPSDLGAKAMEASSVASAAASAAASAGGSAAPWMIDVKLEMRSGGQDPMAAAVSSANMSCSSASLPASVVANPGVSELSPPSLAEIAFFSQFRRQISAEMDEQAANPEPEPEAAAAAAGHVMPRYGGGGGGGGENKLYLIPPLYPTPPPPPHADAASYNGEQYGAALTAAAASVLSPFGPRFAGYKSRGGDYVAAAAAADLPRGTLQSIIIGGGGGGACIEDASSSSTSSSSASSSIRPPHGLPMGGIGTERSGRPLSVKRPAAATAASTDTKPPHHGLAGSYHHHQHHHHHRP